MKGTPPISKVKVALILAIHILRPDLRKLRKLWHFARKIPFCWVVTFLYIIVYERANSLLSQY